MSGFLQRLVNRAQGTTPPLRPSLSGITGAAAFTELGDRPSDHSLDLIGDDRMPGRQRQRRDAFSSTEDRGGLPLKPSPIPAASQDPVNPTDRLLPGERPTAADGQSGRSMDQKAEGFSPLLPSAPPLHDRPLEPRLARQDTAQDPDRGSPTANPFALDAVPERLLPPPPSPSGLEGLQFRGPQPSGDPPSRLSNTDHSAPTREVHVSIGRIEVTALPQATPPPQSRRERNEGLSLEAYLERRRGGGR